MVRLTAMKASGLTTPFSASELAAIESAVQRRVEFVASGTMQKTTQRDRIRPAMARLYRNALDRHALVEAKHILDEAQNGPPEGAADGSLPEALWEALRRQVEAFGVVQDEHERMRRMVGQPEGDR